MSFIPNSNQIYGNSQLVDYMTKYSLINFVSFDNTNVKVMQYDELIKRTHVINCVGKPNNEETVYKIYFPSIKIPYTRYFRQYYQLQTIPIGFLVNNFVIRLIGNASLEYYIDNQFFTRVTNPSYQIPTVGPVPNNLRQEYTTFLYYKREDELELSQSPYYLEPLIIPSPNPC